MLKLRRAIVIRADPHQEGSEQSLLIDLEGEQRAAIADLTLHERSEVGDEVIVNVQALDLDLGSGGFDIVHVNITRGLQGEGMPDAHVMKLPYTSLQHAVLPVETDTLELPLGRPVAVLALHGQLAAVAWAFAQNDPGLSVGYIQTGGGALPGGHSRVLKQLRERGLLAGHISAGASFGGGQEAITVAGALHHGLTELDWDAAICGPGPGIVGSASALGHGGLTALDSAHTALALGCETVLIARMSSGDPRPRHRGISHHTLTVLELLLEPVTVALPAGMRSPVGTELRAGLSASFGGSVSSRPQLELDVERPARIARHDWRRAPVDLPALSSSGLPSESMGRELTEDPLFFGTALAGGTVLSERAAELATSSPVKSDQNSSRM